MELTLEQVANIPRTPWFPGDVKPVRPGWYQRCIGKKHRRAFDNLSYWDGKHWRIASYHGVVMGHALEGLQWRGLARDPYAEGHLLARKGANQALGRAGDDWRYAALNKIREWGAGPCQRRPTFAFEDVRVWALANGLEPPPDHHAWGAIAQQACRLGLIKFTGTYQLAVSPRTHRHPVRLYVVGEAS